MSFMTTAEVENVWRECSPKLRQFVLKRVSDPSVTEDILQDVFLKLYGHIGQLDAISNFENWLYRVTRNTVIDYYRSRKLVLTYQEAVSSTDTPGPNKAILKLIPCVETMVGRLPEKYRSAVILTEYQGLTQKEMGEKLGLSLSGAKSRVQRARARLKGMLTECCHFELDGLGGIISFEPKRPVCDKC